MKLIKWLLIPFFSYFLITCHAYTTALFSSVFRISFYNPNKFELLLLVMLPHFLASIIVSIFSAYLLTAIYKQLALWVSIIITFPAIIISLMGGSSLSNPSIGNLALLFVNIILLALMVIFTIKVTKYKQALTSNSSGTHNGAN
jgi:hypothetical protein